MPIKSLLHFLLIFVLSILLFQTAFPNDNSDTILIGEIDSSLQYLVEMQKNIRWIHPFLDEFHPIVFAESGYLYIFDYDTLSGKYDFVKKELAPFPLPEKVKASFPLSVYDSKPCCIVTKDIFDTKAGYVTIFHEFMHCQQFLTCELKLKKDLKIAQEAAKRSDYSWEINYSFPYSDSLFVEYYSGFMAALKNQDKAVIIEYCRKLKQHLSQVDFEYLVWLEWKEGFARLIENRIQSYLGIDVNQYGKDKPYNRVTFYCGGSRFIYYLIQTEPELYTDIDALFVKMLNY
jgi:hypothetical protein